MQATVIRTGSLDPGEALGFIVNDFNTQYIETFKQQFQDFYNKMVNTGSNIINHASEFIQRITNSNVINQAKALLSNSEVIIKDEIVQLHDWNNITDAGMMTRRYIAANPFIYNRIERNRLNGWGDIWFNNEPDVDPEWRDDYLDVTDGALMFDENGEGYFTWNSFESESKLTELDRANIRLMWDIAIDMINQGYDPTDPEKGRI